MCDSLFSSPARSIGERSLGDPNSLTDSEITESESETLELTTDLPSSPEQVIVDGWVKFRDNKRVSENRCWRKLTSNPLRSARAGSAAAS
ncbi:UNVERIFIED_CONTAM: hypothetical protein PYX00_003454 [Menopon gallinae]|uniref:Uncharacterized protein n=1 Tax=Menopon gallinae TaxID=328185 RepID=A0AAW2I2D7_9NEOP